MNDQKLHELMNRFDDLMEQELEELMGDIEIDIDSISQKAHWKLRKGQKKVSKSKKVIAIIAVSLVAVCSVTTVYASEISQFIQSLTNKTGVYGTVVDGPIYYLENPVALGEGQNLTQAMFQEHGLDIQLDFRNADGPNIRIKIDGKEMEPNGMGDYNHLTFYGVKPSSSFDLIVDEISYPVVLSTSQPIIDGNEIVEVESNDIQWLSMGYKKIPDGIQILTTFEDRSLELVFLEIPLKDRVTQSFERNGENVIRHSNHETLQSLVGTAPDGRTYVYSSDSNDMGRPITKYITDAPAGEEITLHIPGIAVYKDINKEFSISLPEVGTKAKTEQTIDLGLQSMELQTIERTSDTTATLTFALNTGGENDVRVWQAYLESSAFEKSDLLWENGICTMNVTLDKSCNDFSLSVEGAYFIVDGNWVLSIK